MPAYKHNILLGANQSQWRLPVGVAKNYLGQCYDSACNQEPMMKELLYKGYYPMLLSFIT